MPALRRARASASSSVLAALLALAGCDGNAPPPADGGVDAARVPCPDQPPPPLGFSSASVGMEVGATRRVTVDLARDYCDAITLTLTASAPGLIDAPASVTVPMGTSRAEIELTGLAVGTLTLTGTLETGGGTQEATLEVVVADGALPACDGAGGGMVAPGGSASVTSGALTGTALALPSGAARDDRFHVDPFEVAIACAPDAIPDGYVPLGPAVSFTSSTVYRFPRELDVTLPVALAHLPSQRTRADVEVAYVGPGVTTPRVVGVANPVFEGSAGGGTLRFSVPRLGTYQVVARAEPATRVSRRFSYRGLMGFSMGGSGSSRIGLGHPERFDFVAPLGGPTEWLYLLEYIRRYHLGGFCTAEERAAGATGCDAASLARTPASNELFQHTQTFENWWYEDGNEGQGGTFNRSDYIAIFRDLAAMYGNANHDASADGSLPDVVPPGIPDAVRTMPDSARCMAPATVLENFFDDEYNPDGTLPVITFCDGAERRDVPGDPDGREDVGNWDPNGTQTTPIEVGLAVDLDGDGVRDAGEPVIRNGREPFEDVGCDGALSADEAGFDALTNPDPAGDDYDFQYNPTGTEGNYAWDGCRDGGSAEPFEDVGLDGVAGTCQLGAGDTCYDRGEGNGIFDRTHGGERMVGSSPTGYVVGYESNDGTFHDPYPLETLRAIDWFSDSGVRDLFNWVVMGNHALGAFGARGFPVRYFNGHGALHMDGREGNEFDPVTAPWSEMGRYTMVRYGSIDASATQLQRGDGGHVGTTDQLAARVYSAAYMMSARWPGGDHRRLLDRSCRASDPTCENPNILDLDFTSPTTGRTGPVTIVLPPGYFAAENADVDYPVIYFLHGYGMEPGDLAGLGLLMWNDMTSASIASDRRLDKMIFVFPDGRCRNGECLRGTFYTDAPDNNPTGARMQTFLLDLMDHVDANYRARAAETVEVWQ